MVSARRVRNATGIVQTALYLDFFYTYISAKRERIDAPIELPA